MAIASMLQQFLATIGRGGEFPPIDRQDPANTALHYLLVDTHAEKLFKKQRENSLETALSIMSPSGHNKIGKMIAEVTSSELSQEATLMDAGDYILSLKMNKGRSTVDITAFKNALRVAGVSQKKIDEAEAAATGRTAPSKSFTVLEV